MRKMTTTERPMRRTTWLKAIAEAARLQRVELPSFDGFGMGTLRTATTANSRFATLKRRLGRGANVDVDGVEWALWRQIDDLPVLVAAFCEPLEPNQESVAATLSLLKGWLVDEWTPDQAKSAVNEQPGAKPVRDFPPHSVSGS
jgi:hypothetical protein